ncbi:MAG TPA: FecR domain-containing protein [Puia sp.]|nr:FecR domain-containing protein [Puia sp.]
MEELDLIIYELFAKPGSAWADQDWKRFEELRRDHAIELRDYFLRNYAAGTAEEISADEHIRALKVLERIQSSRPEEFGVAIGQGSVRVVPRWRRLAWPVAAAVVLIAGAGYWYVAKIRLQAVAQQVAVARSHDVAPPATNRATITLGNGQKIFLDSVGNGELATQNKVKIQKSGEGVIAYQGNIADVAAQEYNVLSNPRGSRPISLTLNDGTVVWLDAASSLRYPVAFAGSERKVEISGQGYFEVAHDASKPFKVLRGSTQVEVLGTHFDVDAYEDDSDLKVTLLEGKVKVSNDGTIAMLSRGEQAKVNAGGQIIKVSGVDIDEVMAWKNGKFIFSGNDITSVMRQLSRWYDVDVTYQGNVSNEEFVGDISRNNNISAILAMLEKTRVVQFEVEGRKITVEPYQKK